MLLTSYACLAITLGPAKGKSAHSREHYAHGARGQTMGSYSPAALQALTLFAREALKSRLPFGLRGRAGGKRKRSVHCTALPTLSPDYGIQYR